MRGEIGRRAIFAAAAALTVAIAGVARAQTVYCLNCSTIATQLLQQAAQAEQLVNSASQLQQQVTSYLNMLENTASLPLTVVGDVQGDIDTLRQLWSGSQALAYTSQTLSQDFQAKYKGLTGYLANGVSGTDFATKLQQWSSDLNDTGLRTFQTLSAQAASITSDEQRFATLKQHLATSDGQKQALDVMGELLAELVGQNLKTRELLVTQVQLATQDLQTRADQDAARQAYANGLLGQWPAESGKRY